MVSTPIDTNEKLHVDDGLGSVDAKLFRSTIRGLLYLSCTHPDIMHSVALTTTFMATPSKYHLVASNRILRYIARTLTCELCYEDTKKIQFN